MLRWCRSRFIQSPRRWQKHTSDLLKHTSYNGFQCGSAWDPVILPVFKTGARHLRDVVGVFDSHTLPPILPNPLIPRPLR